MVNEQRSSTRVPYNSRVCLCDGESELPLKILDISESGAGLLSPVELPLRERLDLNIDLPGFHQTNTLLLHGVVTHNTEVNSKFLIGFQFTNVTQHDLLVIHEFFNFHDRLFT